MPLGKRMQGAIPSDMSYPWIKTLHIVLVIAWFAGLFCLPRLYFTMAQASSRGSRAVLHAMAKRLLRFTTVVAVPAVLLGLWLFGVIGIGKGPNGGWVHAKVFFMLLAIAFHFACFILLVSFEGDKKGASATFCRRLVYIPIVLLTIIVTFAVLKPF